MSEHGTTYQVDVYGTIDETYGGDLVNVWNESTNRLVLQER